MAVYTWLTTAVWTLTGTRFEGETRGERARRSVEAAFGSPPDVELRTPVVQGGALLASIPAFVIAVVGAACGATFGGDPWFRATLQAVAVCATWSAVAGVRALFSRRDWIRWRTAGRPSTWRRSVLATPGNRDLVYFAVLAVLFAWFVRLSFDASLSYAY
ncbi:hypothetical protein [Cellulomonas sp. RIT-PI-Y]|uniref:hypothetical protein n=1 Tax=Cellulomonas sp. RIT-PI-Y TaxID=3035297 RepID=UPI0021DA81D5|nr:hypothetical protein [Cellulomonas sp. RIT-PI-Y]